MIGAVVALGLLAAFIVLVGATDGLVHLIAWLMGWDE